MLKSNDTVTFSSRNRSGSLIIYLLNIYYVRYCANTVLSVYCLIL